MALKALGEIYPIFLSHNNRFVDPSIFLSRSSCAMESLKYFLSSSIVLSLPSIFRCDDNSVKISALFFPFFPLHNEKLSRRFVKFVHNTTRSLFYSEKINGNVHKPNSKLRLTSSQFSVLFRCLSPSPLEIQIDFFISFFLFISPTMLFYSLSRIICSVGRRKCLNLHAIFNPFLFVFRFEDILRPSATVS